MGDSTFSDAKFSVTNAGALKSISGTIGGFTIADGTLTGGNVQLAAAGTIKVGSVADATTTATTNAGFCLLYTSPSPRDRQKTRMPSSA